MSRLSPVQRVDIRVEQAMKQPSRELVDAFFEWFRNDWHSSEEDYYAETLTRDRLLQLDREAFVEFFFRFAYEGGHVQNGGPRTASRFRATVEEKYREFRSFVLEPFDLEFDEASWLPRIGDFPQFGAGLATIWGSAAAMASYSAWAFSKSPIAR